MQRLAKILAVLAVMATIAGLGALWWDRSDPPGCVSGEDPAVALANDRAGEAQIYSDWCHEHDGVALHVVEAGQGETVLFIHGFPSIWYSLIRPMEALREDYRVVAIDGLGAGLSDAPANIDHYKLATMAEHLDALIADLGDEKIHLVGHDWGAAFALAYAQSRPEKLLSVTGMSAPPQNIALTLLETSEKQRQISAYVERLKSASPVLMVATGAESRIASGPQNHFEAGRMSEREARMLQAATSDMRRINRQIHWYRANLPSPDAITEQDFWPSRDARLEVPTLIVWGNDDTVFDPAFIELVEQSSSDVTVLRLDGVGHAPQFEATEAVNAALAAHLTGSAANAEPSE